MNNTKSNQNFLKYHNFLLKVKKQVTIKLYEFLNTNNFVNSETDIKGYKRYKLFLNNQLKERVINIEIIFEPENINRIQISNDFNTKTYKVDLKILSKLDEKVFLLEDNSKILETVNKYMIDIFKEINKDIYKCIRSLHFEETE